MKKVYLLAAVAMMAAQLQAQNVILDTYVGAQLATRGPERNRLVTWVWAVLWRL